MKWKSLYFWPFKNNTLKLIYEIITIEKTSHSFLFFSFCFYSFKNHNLYIGVYNFVTLYVLIMEPQEKINKKYHIIYKIFIIFQLMTKKIFILNNTTL
jgi:hypothetical protein